VHRWIWPTFWHPKKKKGCRDPPAPKTNLFLCFKWVVLPCKVLRTLASPVCVLLPLSLLQRSVSTALTLGDVFSETSGPPLE